MSTGERPLDFVVILHLSDAPSLDAIRAGAKSAYLHFPTSSSLLNGGAWRFRPDLAERAFRTGGLASQHQTVESFVDQPLNPRTEIPLQQLVISPLAGNRMTLVTRFHHALCDGASGSQLACSSTERGLASAPPDYVRQGPPADCSSPPPYARSAKSLRLRGALRAAP